MMVASTPESDRAALEMAVVAALRESSALSVLFSQVIADRAGVTPTDLEALDVLVRSGPTTPGRLAQLTGLTTGAVTGLIDRLERRGYARREPNPADRRSVLVRAEERAERELAPAYAGMEAGVNVLLSGYRDAELVLIRAFLARAAALTAEQIARLRDAPAPRGEPTA